MLRVYRIVNETNQHFVVRRIAESDRFGRIRVVFIIRRVIEVRYAHDFRAFRNCYRILEVVIRLPREAVVRNLEQHFRAPVGIKRLDRHRSEERRVGKEWRSWMWRWQYKEEKE